MMHISRISEELVTWSSYEFQFVQEEIDEEEEETAAVAKVVLEESFINTAASGTSSSLIVRLRTIVSASDRGVNKWRCSEFSAAFSIDLLFADNLGRNNLQ